MSGSSAVHEVVENGWIVNVDKPVGKTSFNVVSYFRRETGIRKVGHAGSLDPNASGVLLIVVGRGTKQVERLMELQKEYVGTIRLGIETDTYDTEGRVVAERDVSGLKREDIAAALERFRGTISQVPPRYSALKHRGKPLYTYARKGIAITPEPRTVTVYDIGIESYEPPETVVRIVCSRGTYIRSIAHDLGQVLGVGATLSGLRRERIGNYTIENAAGWSEIPEAAKVISSTEHGSNKTVSGH